MGNYEKAAQAYKQAAGLQPASAQSHLNLGVAQQELNDLAGARISYERALDIDPHQSGVLWNLALVLEQQGERQWAEKLYARIGDEAPEWCDANFRLGYLRLLRADYLNSAEAFESCLAKRPDWAEAHLNAGIAYARIGQPDEARHSFQEALMLRPDSSDAVRGLAALALEAVGLRRSVRTASPSHRSRRTRPRAVLQRRPDLSEARPDAKMPSSSTSRRCRKIRNSPKPSSTWGMR